MVETTVATAPKRAPRWLPWAGALLGLAAAFAEGIGTVLASVATKLLAATQMLWAGLSIWVVRAPGQYPFMIVFLGLLIILCHFIRVMGSFVIGGVFALGLFGVGVGLEQALVRVLMVEVANAAQRRCGQRDFALGAGRRARRCASGSRPTRSGTSPTARTCTTTRFANGVACGRWNGEPAA